VVGSPLWGFRLPLYGVVTIYDVVLQRLYIHWHVRWMT